jgi:DNA-binding NarL/FixJ family response regulator
MNPAPKIRVLIVDDHFVVRMGVAASINAEPDMIVVAECASAQEAVAQFRAHRPDITLMDLRLPDGDGAQAIAAIRARFPEARLIALSSHGGDADIRRALDAGAASYVFKSSPRDTLLTAIREVHRTGRHIPPEVAVRLAEAMNQPEITPRELDVLRGIARGRSNKEIAADLGMSEATAKLHVTHLLQKLTAADRTQAALIALRRGIIQLE